VLVDQLGADQVIVERITVGIGKKTFKYAESKDQQIKGREEETPVFMGREFILQAFLWDCVGGRCANMAKFFPKKDLR